MPHSVLLVLAGDLVQVQEGPSVAIMVDVAQVGVAAPVLGVLDLRGRGRPALEGRRDAPAERLARDSLISERKNPAVD